MLLQAHPAFRLGHQLQAGRQPHSVSAQQQPAPRYSAGAQAGQSPSPVDTALRARKGTTTALQVRVVKAQGRARSSQSDRLADAQLQTPTR